MNEHPCYRFRFLIPFAIIGFVALCTFAVHALWNGVLVDVVAVKAITYWQALGLLVLAKILFGGFPCRGGKCGHGRRGRMMGKHWDSLSPEQREKMRNEMRHRFADCPFPPRCDAADEEPDGAGKGTNS